MDIWSIVISLIILLFSVVIHELSHGVVAEKLGDSTARLAGRLTLNPIPHLDLFGSILLPLFLWIATAGQFVLGAAKPVPVNFLNLRNPKRDMALVSLAGPASNFILAIAFAIPLRFELISPQLLGYQILLQGVVINLILGIFNLIPIPPLDGSKVLASFASDEIMYKILSWEKFGFLLIILFLYLGLVQKILIPLLQITSTWILGFRVI